MNEQSWFWSVTTLSNLLDFQVDIAYTHLEFSLAGFPRTEGHLKRHIHWGRAFEWGEQFRKDHHGIWRLGNNLRSFLKSLVKN